jgi:predicted AAA+ superfamily ATPase
MTLTKRKYYFDKIKPFIGKELIKVITGQRRTGKSYFLRQIKDEIENEGNNLDIVYINKENINFDFIKDYKDLVQFAESKKEPDLHAVLMIDEVQEIIHFEKALRHLLASGKWDIYVTGSNSNLLSGELATLISGRYINIEMFPLAYDEFLIFHKLQEDNKSFAKYLKFGGMPYLKNLPLNDEIVFEYLQNITSTILYKDVVARYSVRDIAFLENLTRFIADNIGNLVSAKRISDYLKSQKLRFNHNTVMEYLHHLSDAFLIHKTRRYDIKGKRLLEIGEKNYFNDLGIRNSITGYHQQDISQMLENVVYIHLKRKYNEVFVGKLRDKEVDFICHTSQKKIYIQVTLSLADEKVKNREIGNLLAIKENYQKIIVTADELTPKHIQGVEIYNIRKFLMNF